METYLCHRRVLLLWLLLLKMQATFPHPINAETHKSREELVWERDINQHNKLIKSRSTKPRKGFQNIDFGFMLQADYLRPHECVQDTLHQTFFLEKLNFKLFQEDNIRAMCLIVNGLMIDFWVLFNLGHYLFFGDSLTLVPSLLAFYLFRFLALSFGHWPFPKNYIFQDPGFDSLFIPYDDTNDFFFSGHTGLVVILLFNCWFHLTRKKELSKNETPKRTDFVRIPEKEDANFGENTQSGSEEYSPLLHHRLCPSSETDNNVFQQEIGESKLNQNPKLQEETLFISSNAENRNFVRSLPLRENDQQLFESVKLFMELAYNKSILLYSYFLVVLTVSVLVTTHAHYSNDILLGLVCSCFCWMTFYKYRFNFSLFVLKIYCFLCDKFQRLFSLAAKKVFT
jgi:hypothetical protein